jgi:hypothetical protein
VGSNQKHLKPQDSVFVLRLSDNNNEELYLRKWSDRTSQVLSFDIK